MSSRARHKREETVIKVGKLFHLNTCFLLASPCGGVMDVSIWGGAHVSDSYFLLRVMQVPLRLFSESF